jgi:hypothetical protein
MPDVPAPAISGDPDTRGVSPGSSFILHATALRVGESPRTNGFSIIARRAVDAPGSQSERRTYRGLAIRPRSPITIGISDGWGLNVTDANHAVLCR